MWYLKNSNIIFISILWMAFDSVARGYCKPYFEDYNLAMNQTMLGPRPGEISAEYSSLTGELTVHVLERRESFNLTLLGIPYIKNISDCPVTPISIRENLRQHRETYIFARKPKEKKTKHFEIMFTGCYYFIMTNKQGSTWQWGPEFYETNNTYLDTTLMILSDPKTKPDQNSGSMEVTTILKIPLRCVKVVAQIFQFEKKIEVTHEIEKFKVNESQGCSFIKEGTNLTIECDMPNSVTSLVLDVQIKEATQQEWTAVITWKNLQPGGGTYYLKFTQNIVQCKKEYRESQLRTWNPVNISILAALGPHFTMPLSEPNNTGQNSIIIIMVCISLSIILIVLLVFWRRKCPSFPKSWLHQTPIPENSGELEENLLISNGIESDNILLLYVEGSPSFMDVMSNFRERLAQACNCHVYDFYAQRDWDKVNQFGVKQLVEHLLRNGCKVVWIDTPELRSRCNEQPERYIQANFRDEGILYALQLIRDSYLDCTTQYLYHFVVRMEGLEVKDGYGDPLRAVVPHKRYFFPEQLQLLYQELIDSMKRLKNTKCEA